MQTDATFLTKNSQHCWMLHVASFCTPCCMPKAACKRTQHCWMLHVASVCTPCCMLLDVVACCCAKFETGQTFSPVQTDATLLDVVVCCCASLKPIKLLAPCKRTQHCWLTTPNIVGCYMLRPFAHPVACCCVLLGGVASVWTPLQQGRNNTLVGATMLGVVASVCK